MYEFSSEANLIMQGLLAVIVIGVFYNLWSKTKVFGGIIGVAVRFMGAGMLFVTIGIIERVLVNFQIIINTPNLAMAQDILSLIGLICLGIGFSKLASASNA